MKPRIANIDSFNFSSEDLEVLFKGENYNIEPIKGIGVFEPHRWPETFGKGLTRNIIGAKILHTHTGLTLPIKRYAVSPSKQTLEFAGLHAYNEASKLRRELLKELFEHIQECKISRIDVAIDFKGKIPIKVIKNLSADRRAHPFENTTYYKSEKEKKSNTRLNIKIYDKAKKEKLSYELNRIEFVFLGSYFGKLQIKDLNIAIIKMEKSIKRFSGITVEILPF